MNVMLATYCTVQCTGATWVIHVHTLYMLTYVHTHTYMYGYIILLMLVFTRTHVHTLARLNACMYTASSLSHTNVRTYGTYMCIYVHTVALMFRLKI